MSMRQLPSCRVTPETSMCFIRAKKDLPVIGGLQNESEFVCYHPDAVVM